MRLGVLDVGSNTVNLQIMDAHHGSPPVPHQSFKDEIQIAQFIDPSGAVSALGISKLTSTLNRLKNEARGIQIDEMLAFATSSIREATNSDEIIETVAELTGIELEVLSGEEEARFTFLAVRRWIGWSAGDAIMLDIGGGSLEIAYGKEEVPQFCASVMLGAGRMTRQFLQGDPFTEKSVEKLREHIEITLKPLKKSIGVTSGRSALGTSKTIRTLRRIQQSYLPELGNSLTAEGLAIIVPKLVKMTTDQRRELPGVSSGRAQQIVAGALVAQAAMATFEISKLSICPWALREGIVLQRIDWLKS